MKKTILRSGAAFIAATGLALGLAGCGGGSSDGGDSGAAAEGGPAACDPLKGDLETAKQAVDDALADDPSWAQVMLAPDVDVPTEKYGLLVMPFVATDAADRVQGTVDIKDGKFTIEAETPEGVICTIDQDGKISEAG